jgi:DNA-binding response OmpR family regulator
MEKIEILVVGKHPEIMKTIGRLLNGKGWNCALAFSPDEAIKHGYSTPFNIVLLGAGLSEGETKQVCQHFTVPVVQHYGGGSGLLYAEVYQALGNISPAK